MIFEKILAFLIWIEIVYLVSFVLISTTMLVVRHIHKKDFYKVGHFPTLESKRAIWYSVVFVTTLTLLLIITVTIAHYWSNYSAVANALQEIYINTTENSLEIVEPAHQTNSFVSFWFNTFATLIGFLNLSLPLILPFFVSFVYYQWTGDDNMAIVIFSFLFVTFILLFFPIEEFLTKKIVTYLINAKGGVQFYAGS